jgi:hypothetical protein
MRVREDKRVNTFYVIREWRVCILLTEVAPLLYATINENFSAFTFYQKIGAGHFPGAAIKREFHFLILHEKAALQSGFFVESFPLCNFILLGGCPHRAPRGAWI